MNKIVKRVIIVVSIVVGVLILTIVGAFVYVAIDSAINGADISGINNSYSISVLTKQDYDSSLSKGQEQKYEWYYTLEEAYQNTDLIRNNDLFFAYRNPIENELLKLEDDNQIFLLYAPIHESGTDVGAIISVSFHKKDGKVSQPYIMKSYYYAHEFEASHYFYNYDAEVASFLVEATLFGVSAKANNGVPVYFGTGANKEEVESMKIDNKSPDEIIPIKFTDKTYYFWYYANEKTWQDVLLKIDYSEFTLNEIIDALHIEYTGERKMKKERN